jgi:hypothetical protein
MHWLTRPGAPVTIAACRLAASVTPVVRARIRSQAIQEGDGVACSGKGIRVPLVREARTIMGISVMSALGSVAR